MKKLNPILTGYGVKLRLVNVDDAEFILQLRNMPHALDNMGKLNVTVEQEKTWILKNIVDPLDYFFIIQTSSRIGTVGVYNIDFSTATAEFGRIVVIPNSFVSIPSCVLLFNFCFDTLHLKELAASVVVTNEKAISLYKKLGFKFCYKKEKEMLIRDHYADLWHIALSQSVWTSSRRNITSKLKKA